MKNNTKNSARKSITAILFAVMMLMVFSIFVASVSADEVDDRIENEQELIDQYDLNWTAAETSVSRVPIEELCGGLKIEAPIAEQVIRGASPPPASFDWRDHAGKNWLTGIKHQGCGDCWAFAAAAIFESEIKIDYDIPDEDIDLSELFAVCCGPHVGCTPWFASDTTDWFNTHGTVDEACAGYRGGDCGVGKPDCHTIKADCPNWFSRLNKVTSWGWVGDENPDTIKQAIIDRGPVATYMWCNQSFLDYNGGVYVPQPDATSEGGHFVAIVGWNDNDPAGSCWICKNSWGTGWGEDTYGKTGESGWFRIRMGSNTCAIESQTHWNDGVNTHLPPIADAGPDQTNVEQDSLGGASVTLNGAGSYDPDSDPLTYSWTWPPSGSAAGVNPTVSLPLGTTTITLTVSDGSLTDTDTVDITVVDTTPPVISLLGADAQTIECGDAYTELGATATDVCCGDLTASIVIDASAVDTSTVDSYTVTYDVTDCNGNPAVQVTRTVNVVDTTPPEISVTVSPDTLWPPNHKMVNITATVTVSDICDAAPTVVLNVISDEPDNAKGNGDGDTVNDIQAEIGTEDYEFQLRAERAGTGDGRVYTITYTATDASGNEASAIATVVVPHDMD